MLLAAGERISIALVAMAINDSGAAISLTGRRPGSSRTPAYGKARIIERRATRVSEALAAGRIAIVAGFQGVSTEPTT